MSKYKYVREFDLDAPSLDRKLRSEFRNQTRSTTSAFERGLIKFSMPGAWKVLIEVLPEVDTPTPRNLLGVLVGQVQGNPLNLIEATSEMKREIALDWLLSGSLNIARELGVDGSQLKAAGAELRSSDFRNVAKWIGPKRSPDGTHYAVVVVDLLPAEARIVGRIYSSGTDELLEESLLTVEKPNEFIFSPLFGSLEWTDNSTVKLVSKSGEEEFPFTTRYRSD